ncbi:MAG: LUD domain-containing protein [Candidatus Hydrogenedentes bacterium]|nr:LUD domain-containing protein [Candidatus Hydrogenedentota bacterium]
MASQRNKALYAKIADALENPDRSRALNRCMQRGRDNRSRAISALPDGLEFRNRVKAIKDRCTEQQESLLEKFVVTARERGAKVFLARDGAAAIDYVLELARARNAKSVAKSKSLTTEEIDINDPLLDAGLRVVETDLGELILQLAHERPYHLVFPSVHKMAADVAEIFAKETGQTIPPDIPSIMKVVRAYLRPIFLNADIGMTGANIGVAESGTIVIETNEGNGRLVSSIGDCHVCVMGVEKIVDTFEDALELVLAHPVSASGQLPTTYVTWMGGRSPLGAGEGKAPRESHIIILDNGRAAMRDDPGMREALNCIRCGACMNICPTYSVVGGHTFGYIYPGPIGIPWTAGVHGLEKAGDFAALCISCGLCKEICPAKIDMPMMIAEVKHRDACVHGHSRSEQTMMAADDFARLGSALAPFANRTLKNPLARKAMASILGVDERRNLPPFAKESFTRWFSRRTSRNEGAAHRVAFFVDVFANYNRPDLGVAVVDRLEALGCEVVLPEQKSSGYPYVAYGDLDRAREVAAYNVARFAPCAEQGCDIVAIEPTAAYCLRETYPKLLHHSRKSLLVSDHSYELFAYLNLREGGAAASDDRLRGKRFGFHVSCHQRPLGSGRDAQEWLRRRGADVTLIETGTCCGMGGTFGLKAGPLGYDLSKAAGESLCAMFLEAGVDAIVTESSVCAIQLREGTGLPVFHPLELVAGPPFE